MTAYATRSDLASLGVRAGALTGASTSVQDQHLEAASRWFDTFIGARYPVPLTAPYDAAAVEAVCARAAWTFLRAQGYDPANADDVAIKEGNAEAKELAEGVASGKRHLTLPTAETDADTFTEYLGGVDVLSDESRGW